MSEALTFWDHLDELRTSLFRIICAVALFAVIAFVMKEELFGIILAPRSSDFITYGADRAVYDTHANGYLCRTADSLTLYII